MNSIIMKGVQALRNKGSYLLTVLAIVAGFTMGIASITMGNQAVHAQLTCNDVQQCGCFTTDVGCIALCTRPQTCIYEWGTCDGSGYHQCHFSYCSSICGV